MAFNFYGTFTTGQFLKLQEFAKIQERDLLKRKNYLEACLLRNGVFITDYDPQTYFPLKFEVTKNTYASKLMLAYKSLGGNPEQDMMLRTSDKPVYLTRGTNISSDGSDSRSGYSDLFTNGRRARGSQRFDRDVGIQVQNLKNWQLESIKKKREQLEYKIKRALDYSDQLQREITLIETMLNQDGEKTVDDLINKVRLVSSRTGAQNIVEDLLDFFGLNIGQIFDPTNVSDYENEQGSNLR